MLEQAGADRRVNDLNRIREANTSFSGNQIVLARDLLNAVAPENRCIASGILKRQFEVEDLLDWLGEALDIPLLGIGFFRNVLGDEVLERLI